MRARPASNLVLEFARALGERQSNVLQPLAEAISQVVDPQFRDQCRLLDLQRGVLRLAVKDAGLIPIMRMKWAEPILAALATLATRKRRPAFKVREIRFELGTGGIAIQASDLEAG